CDVVRNLGQWFAGKSQRPGPGRYRTLAFLKRRRFKQSVESAGKFLQLRLRAKLEYLIVPSCSDQELAVPVADFRYSRNVECCLKKQWSPTSVEFVTEHSK